MSSCVAYSTTFLPTSLCHHADAHKGQHQRLSKGLQAAADQIHRQVETLGWQARHCTSFLRQMSENDLNHRRALYAIGVLSKQELEEKLKAEEEAAAAEDDDDE